MAFLTRKEYGELKGWSKQHISKLIQNDRLVLNEAGLVDVDASEQFLAMTRDPSKVGVSARHAQDKQASAPAFARVHPPANASLPSIPDYQRSRARREHAQAEQIEAQVRKENGSLVEASVVDTRVRTLDIVMDAILAGHKWAVDRSITKTYVKDVTDGLDAFMRDLKNQGAVINFEVFADPVLNTASQLEQGKVYWNIRFTDVPPAENPIFRVEVTNQWLTEVLETAV